MERLYRSVNYRIKDSVDPMSNRSLVIANVRVLLSDDPSWRAGQWSHCEIIGFVQDQWTDELHVNRPPENQTASPLIVLPLHYRNINPLMAMSRWP